MNTFLKTYNENIPLISQKIRFFADKEKAIFLQTPLTIQM
jgi:hypothetical protein